VKWTKYQFGNSWQVRRLVWNMPGNSKGGFKHEADLRGLGSPVVHRRAATAASVYMPATF
jgi:hypothetical protein